MTKFINIAGLIWVLMYTLFAMVHFEIAQNILQQILYTVLPAANAIVVAVIIYLISNIKD